MTAWEECERELKPGGRGVGYQPMATREGKEETGPLRNSTISPKIEQGPGAGQGQGQMEAQSRGIRRIWGTPEL